MTFTYPRRPQRWQELAEKFPGLPLLVVDARAAGGLRPRPPAAAAPAAAKRASGPADRPARRRVPAAELQPVLNRLFGLNLYEKLLFVEKDFAPAAGRGNPAPGRPGFSRSTTSCGSAWTCSWPRRSAACLAAGRLGLKTALQLAGHGRARPAGAARPFSRPAVFRQPATGSWRRWLEEIAFREKKPWPAMLAVAGLQLLLAAGNAAGKNAGGAAGAAFPGIVAPGKASGRPGAKKSRSRRRPGPGPCAAVRQARRSRSP